MVEQQEKVGGDDTEQTESTSQIFVEPVEQEKSQEEPKLSEREEKVKSVSFN
jgi:hypothetical protein